MDNIPKVNDKEIQVGFPHSDLDLKWYSEEDLTQKKVPPSYIPLYNVRTFNPPPIRVNFFQNYETPFDNPFCISGYSFATKSLAHFSTDILMKWLYNNLPLVYNYIITKHKYLPNFFKSNFFKTTAITRYTKDSKDYQTMKNPIYQCMLMKSIKYDYQITEEKMQDKFFNVIISSFPELCLNGMKLMMTEIIPFNYFSSKKLILDSFNPNNVISFIASHGINKFVSGKIKTICSKKIPGECIKIRIIDQIMENLISNDTNSLRKKIFRMNLMSAFSYELKCKILKLMEAQGLVGYFSTLTMELNFIPSLHVSKQYILFLIYILAKTPRINLKQVSFLDLQNINSYYHYYIGKVINLDDYSANILLDLIEPREEKIKGNADSKSSLTSNSSKTKQPSLSEEEKTMFIQQIKEYFRLS